MQNKMIKLVTLTTVMVFGLALATVSVNAQVKKEAAKVGAKAYKIGVVFNDVVKLTDDIQKISYSPNAGVDTVKDQLEELFKSQGLEVSDENGEGVEEVHFFIGIDDKDDDNDGTLDSADTDDFGSATPNEVKDSDITVIDLDETNGAETSKLSNNKADQGIYILVVIDDHVVQFTMDEDVLSAPGKDDAEARIFNKVARSGMAFGFAPARRSNPGWSKASNVFNLVVQAYVPLLKKYVHK